MHNSLDDRGERRQKRLVRRLVNDRGGSCAVVACALRKEKRRREGKERVNAMSCESLEKEGRIHTEFDYYDERLCAGHSSGLCVPTSLTGVLSVGAVKRRVCCLAEQSGCLSWLYLTPSQISERT